MGQRHSKSKCIYRYGLPYNVLYNLVANDGDRAKTYTFTTLSSSGCKETYGLHTRITRIGRKRLFQTCLLYDDIQVNLRPIGCNLPYTTKFKGSLNGQTVSLLLYYDWVFEYITDPPDDVLLSGYLQIDYETTEIYLVKPHC